MPPRTNINPIQPLDRTPPPITPVSVNIPEPVAANRAIEETVGLNDLSKLSESYEGNRNNSTFLLDVTKDLYANITSNALQDVFTQEISKATSDEERNAILLKYSSEINR